SCGKLLDGRGLGRQTVFHRSTLRPPRQPLVRDSLTFIKAHAHGNDFLLVSTAAVVGMDDLPALARRVCARHSGIGADGMMVLAENSAGARSRLFNADGTFSELSGNGVRCAGAPVAHRPQFKLGQIVLT